MKIRPSIILGSIIHQVNNIQKYSDEEIEAVCSRRELPKVDDELEDILIDLEEEYGER